MTPKFQITLSYCIYFGLDRKIVYELQIVAIVEMQIHVCLYLFLEAASQNKSYYVTLGENRGITLNESAYHFKCYTCHTWFSLAFAF